MLLADETAIAGDANRVIQGDRGSMRASRLEMDRMVAKGLLTAKKERHVTLYSSAITRAQAQRGELLYALKNAFNGALTPMVQCLIETKELNAAELGHLESLIKAKKKGAKK